MSMDKPFTIRWDVAMGCYRLSEPNIEGPTEVVPMQVLHSDRFLDRVLDELSERAGHERHSDAIGLARWDLKAAIDFALSDGRN